MSGRFFLQESINSFNYMSGQLIVRALLVRINVNSADQRGMHEVSFSDISWVTRHVAAMFQWGIFKQKKPHFCGFLGGFRITESVCGAQERT